MNFRQFVCTVALLGLCSSLVSAMPVRVDTERIPIGRLITNLEARVRQNSQDHESMYALARVHSFAYALDAQVFDVKKADGKPFFGYFGASVLPPKRPGEPVTVTNLAAATNHLMTAIALYRKAVTLQPNKLAYQLGLGWCLDQAKQKDAALAAYRKALSLAWDEEKSRDALMESFTEEIVGYMLPLLDPKKDQQEIKKLQGYQTAIGKKGRMVTPILLPLDPGATFGELVNPNAAVLFDLDGSGVPKRWGWITPKAGWLVFDRSGRDEIVSGLQLMGNVTFWIFWDNGYQALAALDDNGDGILDGNELNGLAVWQDKNGNGISDSGEVQSLTAMGVTSLSCASQTNATGVLFNPAGVTFRDGSTRATYDWVAPGRQ